MEGMLRLVLLACVLILPALVTHAFGESTDEFRSRSGLLALYDFSESDHADVRDRANVGAPLNLEIDDVNIFLRSEGSLKIKSQSVIRSRKAATRLNMAIKRSSEITVEAWLQPSKLDQKGPARILTISKDSNERNITLGQEGDRYEVRLRTTKTSKNGIPSLKSPERSLTTDLTHVVYTHDRSGRTRIYLNGKMVTDDTIQGSMSNWSNSYRLALGNEPGKGRAWLGTYHLVALYSRDLRPQEVARHYQLGPEASTEPPVQEEEDPNKTLFSEAISSIMSKHCLECHDTANRKGKLDLSSKAAVLAKNEEDALIVPGNSAESLLWDVVASDEMPEDRDPLSPTEKALLKEWIDGGARWATDTIDPLAHKRDRRANENWVRRLTIPEYIETVRSAVGVDIAKEARELLPPDMRADGFSNTAYNLSVGFGHIEAYARVADIIVSRMDIGAFARQFSKKLKFTDKEMGLLIANMGKWLLRGPLEDHEIIAYRGISTSVASAGGSYEEAVRFIVEAMLQSPRFIYQMENQRGDGKVWPVSEHELASRMSYILWGAPPDKALAKAADQGELYDPKLVEAHVDRMLEDPRAIDRSLQFVSQWLNLDRLQNMRPNEDKFPEWDPALADDMKAETLAFFKDLAWAQKRPLADLLNAQFTYTTPRLARHYNLGAEVTSEGLQRVSLERDAARGGILTQGSLLTMGGDDASMVTRGLFVLHDLLRSGVNDPPPGTDTTQVPTKPGLPQRAIAEKRVADRSCGGCHSKFEPLAYGLEKFDGLGSFFEKDPHGNTLRDDGEILFPGESEPVPYESAAELMNLLATSERVQENLTWKVAQFALGRPLVDADTPILEKVHRAAQNGGGTYQSLIKAIVLSDLVQTTRTEATRDS